MLAFLLFYNDCSEFYRQITKREVIHQFITSVDITGVI